MCLFLFDLTFCCYHIQEIQKIVVFEGAFEKIFSIIKEEGGSEGGVVVQVVYIPNKYKILLGCSHLYGSLPSPKKAQTTSLFHTTCTFHVCHIPPVVLC